MKKANTVEIEDIITARLRLDDPAIERILDDVNEKERRPAAVS